MRIELSEHQARGIRFFDHRRDVDAPRLVTVRALERRGLIEREALDVNGSGRFVRDACYRLTDLGQREASRLAAARPS